MLWQLDLFLHGGDSFRISKWQCNEVSLADRLEILIVLEMERLFECYISDVSLTLQMWLFPLNCAILGVHMGSGEGRPAHQKLINRFSSSANAFKCLTFGASPLFVA